MDATDRERGTRRRWTGFALIAIMAFGAMAGGAAAHDPKPPHSEHGELTYHDSVDGEEMRDLECTFWVKGTNVTHAQGTILVGSHNHDDQVHAHTAGEWEGEPNGSGGYNFTAGPFQLQNEGQVQIYAVMDSDDDERHRTGGNWVQYNEVCENPDEHENPPPPECALNLEGEAQDNGDVELTWDAANGAEEYMVQRAGPGEGFQEIATVESTSYTDTETEHDTEYDYTVVAMDGPRTAQQCNFERVHTPPGEDDQQDPQTPACPEDLTAQAHGNENVALGWNASADADSYHVYRATEDGEMEHVAEVTSTSYTDQETEAQTTYTFEVTAANEAGEAEDCARAEVTAIPFFTGPALVAMAAIGSVGAVAAVRTRRG